MKVNGKVVKSTYFTRYCKSRLGYASRENVGLYDLVCMALEVDGLPMPMNIRPTLWVKENLDHILGKNKIEKLPSCSSKKSIKPKTILRPNAVPSVASNAFLASYEWRKVRMQALKKYGPRCMCCGSTPANGAIMNVDHIKPRKLFPELALDVNNLQILCHDCNHGKGNWDQTDWRKPL